MGPPAGGALRRRAGVRRSLRRQPPPGRGREEGDRRRLPDLHQPRRDARPGEARAAHGDDGRRHPRGLHREGPRAGGGRAHREADGDRRGPVPPGPRRREAQWAQPGGDLQLPLLPQAPEDQGAAPGRRDRSGDLRGLLLVPRHFARGRLLPPLAPPAGEERLALGAQVQSPLRPRELVARRRPRRGLGVREPAAVREAGRVPPHELPPVPGQGEVRVPLGHHEEPPAGVPVRGVREGRRLPA